MPDIPCPQCGQANEPEREVCWACCTLLKPQETKSKEAPPAQPEILDSLPGSIPVQPEGGIVRVTSSVKTAVTINGKHYANLAEVPEPQRSEILKGLAGAHQAMASGKKRRFVFNGKEYERWEDVPEEFRSQLRAKMPDIDKLAQQGPPEIKTSGVLPKVLSSFGLRSGLPAVPMTLDSNTPVAPPSGFRLDDDGSQRRVSWRWMSWRALPGIVFFAFWCGLLSFILYLQGHWHRDTSIPPLAADALAGAVIGLYAYVSLAYLINRTTVVIDAARVAVEHGPLPWFGTKDVPKAGIVQVFCEAYDNGRDERNNVRYRVKLLLKDGKTLKLVRGLATPEEALFVEQQVRRA